MTTRTRTAVRSTRCGLRVAGLAATVLPVLLLGAGPAHAESAPDVSADAGEYVALVAEPAVHYLQTTVEGYVLTNTGDYIGPLEISSGCTTFSVAEDGYLVTAGHCVDVSPGAELNTALIEAAVAYAVEEQMYTWDDGSPITQAELLEFALVNWLVEGPTAGSQPDVEMLVQLQTEDHPLPAILKGLTPFDEGDTAVLKVNATGLPVLELAPEEVPVSTEVTAVGFAGASDDVSDPSMSPTYRGGEVTSNGRTQGGGALPVYEVSAALSGGMSGGPTLDDQGRVIGVNSYGHAVEQNFNFVQPASIAVDLLPGGADNELNEVDQTYREAVQSLTSGDAAAAVKGFDAVLDTQPNYPLAEELRERAASAMADQTPTPGTDPDPDSGVEGAATGPEPGEVPSSYHPADQQLSTSLLVIGGAASLLVAAVASTGAVLLLQRRRSGPPHPQGAQPMPVWQPPSPQEAAPIG
jgi:hypothetical protein